MAVGRHARRDNLEGEGDGLVLVDGLRVGIGEGEDHVPIVVGAGQGSVGCAIRVVLQGDRG